VGITTLPPGSPVAGRPRSHEMQHLPRPMRWLENGVPLTLLVDLLDPNGPDSTRMLEDEPADTAWVPHLNDK